MAIDNEIIHDFVDALKEPPQDSNTTYSAKVSRIDKEGTVWVRLSGAEKETPTAYTSADVEKDDDVTVEWRNNKLYISGNYSKPAVGVQKVLVVEKKASEALSTADKAAQDAIVAHEAATSATASAATAGRAASVAQAAAEAAQETANTKRTVFVMQPMPPYHVGDLWVREGDDEIVSTLVTDQGFNIIDSDGNLFEAVVKGATVYVCTFARSQGAFNESDWSLAATDNTSVNELREWFWHDRNGAHILGDETGYRNDLDSTGMHIVDTATEELLADFGVNQVMLASGDALLKYTEDGSVFGLPDSHRVVLAKNTDDFNARNDATLSSRSVSSFTVDTPMAFANATHKKTLTNSYGQIGLYAWGGQGGLSGAIPFYIVLTNGTLSSGDIGKSNALAVSVPKVVVDSNNFSITENGSIISDQIDQLLQDAAVGVDADAMVTALAQLPHVEEEGTSTNWRYRVWSTGFTEAWFSGTVTVSVTTPKNNVHCTDFSLAIPSQVGFSSAPTLNLSLNGTSDVYIGINGTATSATAISGHILKATSNTSTATVSISVYAWGFRS